MFINNTFIIIQKVTIQVETRIYYVFRNKNESCLLRTPTITNCIRIPGCCPTYSYIWQDFQGKFCNV